MDPMSPTALVSKAERRRRVFLAARTTFVDANAQIRDRSTMIKVISHNEQPFRQVIQSFTKPVVFDVILNLLTKQVFESTLKAKLTFPELFAVSEARSRQHAASEQDAARSEREALEEFVQSNDNAYCRDDDLDQPRSDREEGSRSAASGLPSLFPAYLSFATQHKLLNAVQKLLEECCFGFATKWLPKLLQERGWDCAEAVELGRWSEILPSRLDELASDATSLESPQSLREILTTTVQLRHAAVHRLPINGKRLEQMLQSSLDLTKALKDHRRTFRIEAVLNDFQVCHRELGSQKNHLENNLDSALWHIEGQRSALEREEQEAKESMARKDIENTKTMSLMFEGLIDNKLMDDDSTALDPEADNDGDAGTDNATTPDKLEPRVGGCQMSDAKN